MTAPTRRTAASRGVPDIIWRLWLDDLPPAAERSREDQSVLIDFRYFDTDEWQGQWVKHRDTVLREWVRLHPGSRPSTWWAVDAPEPRRRLAGIGTPSHERLAHAEHYVLGVPDQWITQDQVCIYREHMDTELGIPALDPENPPVYESEAAYLARLGLLLPGERKRLKKADFEPVSLLDILTLDDEGH